jgi:ubiquinol-cytochrome c reductase cytochrome b subunit
MQEVPRAAAGLGGWLDDRFGGAKGVRVLMRKVFPDHWTFMLGEIALWSFVILLLTGTYLALSSALTASHATSTG